MSEVFTIRPNGIQMASIKLGRMSLSPSDYRSIQEPTNSRILSTLIHSQLKGREIGSNAYMPKSTYRFLKTVNISESYCLDETNIEFCKRCSTAIKPKNGALLIAKDGGTQGLGESCLYQETPGLTDYISAGILCLEFSDELERNYVLGVLKSKHFKEYIDAITPGGSTIRHSKLLTLDYSLPWSESDIKRHAVANLVANLIDKEEKIKAKNLRIDHLIASELSGGLVTGTSMKVHPSRFELMATTRLDSGLYSKLVRETDHLIMNYKGGYYHIPDFFTANRGQNLQVSSIGESYYSDTPKNGFYRLFTNVEMTDLRTITGFRWLGNKRKLATLPENCVMLAADGMIVGRSFFFDKLPNTITNIHPWVITAKDKTQPRYKSVFLSLFLSYLKNIGYLEKIKDKSNGGGLKANHVEKWIRIPLFPEGLQEQIASYYYNNVEPLDASATLAMQKERNSKQGIFQLNMEILAIRGELEALVSDIILNG
ncbi:MAG TPA: hypothetical protein VJ987_00660 [Anaerolineales bacterium]|nr:hypothetical protein [Anaerolineales bacterium]